MVTLHAPNGAVASRRRGMRLAALAASFLLAITGMTAVNQSAHAAMPAPNTTAPRPSQAAPMAGGGPLYSYGGPVLKAPRVYLLFWDWTSDPDGVQSDLINFVHRISCSSWLKTVNQYGGAGYCVSYEGAWSDSTAIPTTPSDSQIQQEALKLANYVGVSHSDMNAIFVVATPSGHNTSGFGSSYCAYHSVVSGTSLPYIDLPYMPNAGTACGAGSVTGSSLDGYSIVLGHELAEVITDPQGNGWHDASGNEIADICAWTGLADINLNGTYFPMQPLWSNAANACVQGS